MKSKRVVCIADFHCGHRVGLTPPDWHQRASNKWGKIQRELWRTYTRMIDALKPIDILIVNGDCIDGKGGRSGSSEHITVDRNEQVDMATTCIKYCESDQAVITYGTSYHSGREEDWEDAIARNVGAEDISGQAFLDINGILFDVKHKIGGTTVPYSKGTQISKDRLWNLIWNEHGEQQKADIVIRSHVHSFFHCGESNWLGIVTPALQGQGSKFGSRQCVQHVDFGLVFFDITEEGEWSWDWDIVVSSTQKSKPLKFR